MEIDSYSIGYQNGYKDAEDKYKPKELDLEKKEVIRTLDKLANDYLVYPNETKALDYAIRELEMPSIINDVLDKIREEIKEWYWQADKQALAKDPCVIDAMVDLFIQTIDKYKVETER